MRADVRRDAHIYTTGAVCSRSAARAALRSSNSDDGAAKFRAEGTANPSPSIGAERGKMLALGNDGASGADAASAEYAMGRVDGGGVGGGEAGQESISEDGGGARVGTKGGVLRGSSGGAVTKSGATGAVNKGDATGVVAKGGATEACVKVGAIADANCGAGACAKRCGNAAATGGAGACAKRCGNAVATADAKVGAAAGTMDGGTVGAKGGAATEPGSGIADIVGIAEVEKAAGLNAWEDDVDGYVDGKVHAEDGV